MSEAAYTRSVTAVEPKGQGFKWCLLHSVFWLTLLDSKKLFVFMMLVHVVINLFFLNFSFMMLVLVVINFNMFWPQ
jgi:hypothetical protein